MTCQVCGDELKMTNQPGLWVCSSDEQHYSERNNITVCQSPSCPNFIYTETGTFNELTELYCDFLSTLSELYIYDDYGCYYEETSCLEFASKGIRKKRVKKGIILTCIECDGQFVLNDNGHLVCRDCASEIDRNTSLFLRPIYDPSMENDTIKRIKLF